MDQDFLKEVIRLAFAIERTVASDLDNPYCRSARVLAEQLRKLATQQSKQADGCQHANRYTNMASGAVFCRDCGVKI